MPPYLSPEWVQAFNDALAGLDLTDAIAAAGAGSLTVSEGSFRVAQIVTDAPPGLTHSPTTEVRTVLTVDDGRITFQMDPGGSITSNVTVVLSYGDAVAIARGTLSPAGALATGRIRVRGELSVLVAGQAILNAASAALGGTLADLTDLADLAEGAEVADPAGAGDAGDADGQPGVSDEGDTRQPGE